MEDLLQLIKEYKEKAIKYDNMKDRYLKIANQLRKSREIIEECLSELDPVGQVKTRRTSGVNIKVIIEELYTLLQSGTEISFDFIEKTYPALKRTQCYYIVDKLGQMSNVDMRKEGNRKFLFAKKDY